LPPPAKRSAAAFVRELFETCERIDKAFRIVLTP
jgi:hypothetical protein